MLPINFEVCRYQQWNSSRQAVDRHLFQLLLYGSANVTLVNVWGELAIPIQTGVDGSYQSFTIQSLSNKYEFLWIILITRKKKWHLSTRQANNNIEVWQCMAYSVCFAYVKFRRENKITITTGTPRAEETHLVIRQYTHNSIEQWSVANRGKKDDRTKIKEYQRKSGTAGK